MDSFLEKKADRRFHALACDY